MSNFKLPSIRVRLGVMAAGVALLFVVAALKGGMLQLNRGKALLSLSNQQTSRSIHYAGRRGDILDRNGHILSTSAVVSSIWAEPRSMSDPEKVATELFRILPQKQSNLAGRLNSNRSFAWVLRRADPNIANRIMAAKLEGIKVMKEERRFYPNHALLGQVLGNVSIDGKATGGVERALNNVLEPKSWRTRSIIDAKGDPIRPFLAPESLALNGSNITLTIDRDIQYVAEETLLRTVREHGAKGGWAIVMKPKTGEILALANVPLYNPNRPGFAKDAARNQAISRTGEPGSTFKIVTFASAFENGVISPADDIDCENGVYDLGFMTIRDVVKKGELSVTEVFKYSSNVGTYKIAEKVGAQRIYQTIRNFGFGDTPGLGLIEEAKGSVTSPETWGKTRFANISFGYGLMASSLQLLLVASAIANDGILVPPKLFDRTDVIASPKRVLSEVAAKQVKEIMFADTLDGGTGKKASIRGVEVAGKTGTAEKVDPATGRYSKEHNLSSFVGFAPVNSPEVVAIVVIDEPRGIAYGGYVAAPAWQRIVSTALIRLGVIGASGRDKGIHETRSVAQRKRRQVVAERLNT